MAIEKGSLKNYTKEQLHDEITKVNNHPLFLIVLGIFCKWVPFIFFLQNKVVLYAATYTCDQPCICEKLV